MLHTLCELCPSSSSNRNSSSKIDVDNYDNLQTLYTNIKISHTLAMTHPQANIAGNIRIVHSMRQLFVAFLRIFVVIVWLRTVLVVCIAVKFPVFYSFSRAHIAGEIKKSVSEVERMGWRAHTHIHIMCCTRWLIVDACVANILCLPFNSLVKVQKL